jgi:hypothetical protein
VNADDRDRAAVLDHLTRRTMTIRGDDFVDAELEDASFEDRA